jgi:hypothetical protein
MKEMRTERVKGSVSRMTRFALRYHYACADHVIAMWYDSEEDNNIILMFHTVIWIRRSDDENDRWDGVSDFLLQEH